MKKMSRVLVAGLVAVSLALWASKAVADQDTMRVTEAWALALPGTATTAGVYLSMTNTGTTPDELTGVVTPVATKADLSESKVVNGVVQMRLLKSVVIAPGKTVVLAPDGKQIVLVGLTAPLQKGATIPLILTFARAGERQVSALITSVAATHGRAASADTPHK